jgi:hypothetical protein
VLGGFYPSAGSPPESFEIPHASAFFGQNFLPGFSGMLHFAVAGSNLLIFGLDLLQDFGELRFACHR